MSPFDLEGLKGDLIQINKKLEAENIWDNPDAAQGILKEKKAIENKVNEYEKIGAIAEDIEVLTELAELEDDESVVGEIKELFDLFKSKTEELKLRTLLTGEYDANSAIITLHAGTGGVEAMDWAEMLMRMYVRWAEKHGYGITVADLQNDTEAGIKSATIIIDGENAYGYLKNERGVHRLVRISPFNAQGKRQTSFASLDVAPALDDDIDIEIDQSDIRVDTYRSSGAGGQHVNKTDSAVRITHLPTNIVVTCQNERSQHQNRDVAMRILKGKLMELAQQQQKKDLKELKGDFSQNTWGSQIRSYVFQPYTMVKDHRTNAEVGNVQAVMDGDIDYFINEKLRMDV